MSAGQQLVRLGERKACQEEEEEEDDDDDDDEFSAYPLSIQANRNARVVSYLL